MTAGQVHNLETSHIPVAELRTYHRNPRRGNTAVIARVGGPRRWGHGLTCPDGKIDMLKPRRLRQQARGVTDREGVDMGKATCKIDQCDRPVVGRGWCNMHWLRWRKTGDPGEADSRKLSQAAEKLCRACGEVKKISEFYMVADPRKVHGMPRPATKCKPCMIAATRDWQARNPERARELDNAYKRRTLRQRKLRTYGLTELEYTAMEASQQGVCRVCRQFVGDDLVIDHDHATGDVRGLLCGPCNLGLGAFRDDPARLIRAAKYLGRGALWTRS